MVICIYPCEIVRGQHEGYGVGGGSVVLVVYFSVEELVVCLLKRTAPSISIFVYQILFSSLSHTSIHTCTLSCHAHISGKNRATEGLVL